jgi:threonine/homoserine/homoserine lactone efflux protein
VSERLIDESAAVRDTRTAAPALGFAVASMVLGIVWLFWLGSLLAIIFGHIARHYIKRSGVRTGNGMAIAGLILGYGAFLILLLAIPAGGTFHVELHV